MCVCVCQCVCEGVWVCVCVCQCFFMVDRDFSLLFKSSQFSNLLKGTLISQLLLFFKLVPFTKQYRVKN